MLWTIAHRRPQLATVADEAAVDAVVEGLVLDDEYNTRQAAYGGPRTVTALLPTAHRLTVTAKQE
ncbi:hypothetical protein GCM10010339_89490 [Streptomyces alanosinicus]|uniref:Uncharacterized protein n=1 Tax=Streptomyces alanosinicus TaxID=68171 RepID=A0A918YU67_9ACTN|nr:hypothetical protein GCM10010339_89490 [Streptomyces alanosinicus]